MVILIAIAAVIIIFNIYKLHKRQKENLPTYEQIGMIVITILFVVLAFKEYFKL
jgi:hypothetical protein